MNPAGRQPTGDPEPAQRDSHSVDDDEGQGFPIAGVGASAGGLGPLKEFFDAMPESPGLAFVVIQHLDPTRPSLTPELLSSHTTMSVTQVAGDVQVNADCVYVIPPNKYLSIADGTLRLSEPKEPRGARMAIDYFLRSLAEDQQQCAIGVIFSGTGTDGTLGIKAVKAAGGLVMVQEPATADFDGMPRSAIETGAVDYVLPVAEIPGKLVDYARHPYVLEPRADEEAASQETAPAGQQKSDDEQKDSLSNVLAALRSQSRFDFRAYKTSTLLRRTRRRMCLLRLDDVDDYRDYLQEHPEEADALVKDMLISVTDFFRDRDAWDTLQELVIAPLVAGKDMDEPIRVWVSGCATGEEPYTIAMMLLEELKQASKHCPLQIFASDIDRDALNHARMGRYPASIEADVSPERLQRFFTKLEDDHYQVNKALRESVVFAEQNVIADPPFSRLDLICCRNLLIYLKPEIQDQLISMFHFTLRDGGWMFLGNSETIGRRDDLFRTHSKRWRIFQRTGQSQRADLEIPILLRSSRRTSEGPVFPTNARNSVHLENLAQRRVLEWLAASAVLIDRHWKILYICGDVDAYMSHQSGVPTHDLLANLRPGLRSKLRGAVHQALEQKQAAFVEARVQRADSYFPVRLVVQPIREGDHDEPLVLVIFDDGGDSPEERDANEPTRLPHRRPAPQDENLTEVDEHTVIRQLEDELASTKEDLKSTIEQLETSNEEYKASNEEVMSINEELQSTNEELETSKEELQSLNEELTTVNNQLAAKVDELETRNADLTNLIAATDVATICLDTDLCIRWFTPAAREIVRLSESDKGRPLSDLSHDLTDDDLPRVAGTVLSKLTPAEAEVTCHDDRHYLRRVSPYRTDDNRICGVVITFVDITERQRREHDLARLAAIVEQTNDAVLSKDLDGVILTWNHGAEQMYGYTAEEAVGSNVLMLFPEDRRYQLEEFLTKLRRGQPIPAFETVRIHKDGTPLEVALTISPIYDRDNHVIAASAIAHDISGMKSAQKAAESASRAKTDFLANVSHEIRTPMTSILGYADLLAKSPEDENRDHWIATIRENGRCLLDILNDVLDLSRIEAGRVDLYREQFELNPLLSTIHSLMAVRADEKGISFQFESDGRIPRTIDSDPKLVRQILINLIGNAIKFTDEGSVRVVIRYLPAADSIHFDVIDTGVGIPEDEQDLLFQPFMRASTDERPIHEGTGLGLAICQRLVQHLGGSLTLESQVGKGSRFSFNLLVGPNAGDSLVKLDLNCRSAEAAQEVQLPQCRVLVVDDTRATRYLVQKMVEKAGGTVMCAFDGQKAVEVMQRSNQEGRPFDIVLMDMRMPEMDGYEATARIRELGIQTPVIALTAHVMEGERHKCIEAGCNDYLSKPLDQQTLVDAIVRQLNAQTT
ncbi:Aerobic respiration control sensor protein ArcB [Maioricimonas rarisocia]|uniref:histidine kinase n=1 Tax=Maioricimonas rarisocia TaxID=2528026 RepID=A0A517Z2Z8_9PLAN|nr:CheR family methyltransferase [Maioricimonas rarisocia]QDU36859.1 Aerobic respiration control sensor protein ArcB [Maioricimonas rarisocia]